MKVNLILLTVSLLVLSNIILVAQLPLAPILVDEHPQIPCDESLARLDAFYAELQNNPESTGLISIAAYAERRRDSVFRQASIEAYTRFRGFDLRRIKIIRARAEHEMKISFWRVPSSASEPQIDVDESYEVPRTVKPFLFGWEEEFGDPICPEIDQGEIFSHFLKANPSARANLVFRGKSALATERLYRKTVSTLVNRYGVPRNRIRVFLLKRERLRSAHWQPIVEF
ncbi:MAG TPA: hypothetical protein VGQ55_14960, partial [Pyrinomonadaceae bacterium]|nr:hypothetical protein [Pyrinomonadaceae bacterium]